MTISPKAPSGIELLIGSRVIDMMVGPVDASLSVAANDVHTVVQGCCPRHRCEGSGAPREAPTVPGGLRGWTIVKRCASYSGLGGAARRLASGQTDLEKEMLLRGAPALRVRHAGPRPRGTQGQPAWCMPEMIDDPRATSRRALMRLLRVAAVVTRTADPAVGSHVLMHAGQAQAGEAPAARGCA